MALAAVFRARDSERCVCRDENVGAAHVEIVDDAMVFGIRAPDCGDLVGVDPFGAHLFVQITVDLLALFLMSLAMHDLHCGRVCQRL